MGRCKMRLCELENKEVINACDCKKLGYIVDLIIDECNGCIEAMVIPKAGKLCGFFCDGSEYENHQGNGQNTLFTDVWKAVCVC